MLRCVLFMQATPGIVGIRFVRGGAPITEAIYYHHASGELCLPRQSKKMSDFGLVPIGTAKAQALRETFPDAQGALRSLNDRPQLKGVSWLSAASVFRRQAGR